MARQLIIAGFHRSGTSLITALLHAAGLPLGETLLGPDSDNRHGHFEDLEILDFHERVLAHFGYTWATAEPVIAPLPRKLASEMTRLAEERNRRLDQWGFKDPRVCLLLDAWRSAISDMKVLMVFRDPETACESLVQRERTASRRWWRTYPGEVFTSDPSAARTSWQSHNRALIAYAERHPEDVLVLSVANLVGGFPVVRALEARWGFDLVDVSIDAVYDPRLLRPSLGVSERSPTEAKIWSRLEALEKDSTGCRL